MAVGAFDLEGMTLLTRRDEGRINVVDVLTHIRTTFSLPVLFICFGKFLRRQNNLDENKDEIVKCEMKICSCGANVTVFAFVVLCSLFRFSRVNVLRLGDGVRSKPPQRVAILRNVDWPVTGLTDASGLNTRLPVGVFTTTRR